MKNIKDFINTFKIFVIRPFCKHSQVDVASCPFTGKTYTDCLRCFKRLSVEVTK